MSKKEEEEAVVRRGSVVNKKEEEAVVVWGGSVVNKRRRRSSSTERGRKNVFWYSDVISKKKEEEALERRQNKRNSEKLARHLHNTVGTEAAPPTPGPEVRLAAPVAAPPPDPPRHPRCALRTSFHVQHRTVTTDPLLALVLAHVRVIAFRTTTDHSLTCSSLCVLLRPPPPNPSRSKGLPPW